MKQEIVTFEKPLTLTGFWSETTFLVLSFLLALIVELKPFGSTGGYVYCSPLFYP